MGAASPQSPLPSPANKSSPQTIQRLLNNKAFDIEVLYKITLTIVTVLLSGYCRILSSPEVLKLVKQRLADGDDTAQGLAEQNAKLEVDVATLQSQILSMTSQLTALQLANSQLVAEKDEVINIAFVLLSDSSVKEISVLR